jgi:hypothetical protein
LERRKERKEAYIRNTVLNKEREINRSIEDEQTFLTSAGIPLNTFDQKQKEAEIIKKKHQRDIDLTALEQRLEDD